MWCISLLHSEHETLTLQFLATCDDEEQHLKHTLLSFKTSYNLQWAFLGMHNICVECLHRGFSMDGAQFTAVVRFRWGLGSIRNGKSLTS